MPAVTKRSRKPSCTALKRMLQNYVLQINRLQNQIKTKESKIFKDIRRLGVESEQPSSWTAAAHSNMNESAQRSANPIRDIIENHVSDETNSSMNTDKSDAGEIKNNDQSINQLRRRKNPKTTCKYFLRDGAPCSNRCITGLEFCRAHKTCANKYNLIETIFRERLRQEAEAECESVDLAGLDIGNESDHDGDDSDRSSHVDDEVRARYIPKVET